MVHSILSAEISIEGNVEALDSVLEIEGKITGDVTAPSVIVGPNGNVDGTIRAESVTVQGHLSGRVECQDLKVWESARLRAEICAGKRA